jgi:metallophosphoesterase (TIGR03767 family)
VPNPDTRITRVEHAVPNENGWRNLEIAPGEKLSGEAPSDSITKIANFIHISDLHICDAQSPARAEHLDRYADPHHPLSELVKYVGTYRAQEILTTQTLEALVRSINLIDVGPLTGEAIDAVVVTGDVTDNAQSNELSWYFTLLDGGEITPDSGDLTRWEGVASVDPANYDPSYWNPEGTPTGCTQDYPRALYGFPKVPGLTDAVRKSFRATGIKHKWFATHGNHDALLQGTVRPDDAITEFAQGDQRVAKLAADTDLAAMFGNFTQVGPTSYPQTEGATFDRVTADARRKINDKGDWSRIHTDCGHDHGLNNENRETGKKYWAKDVGRVRIISMDTVNEFGGWQGSIDRSQFEWITSQLADPTPRYFLFLSHHPASTLFNLYAPAGEEPRVGEEELVSTLLSDERVILWLAGHNHEHKIERISTDKHRGFWHIQTASNIDWPQQGRIVEIFEDSGKVGIATSVFDHQGDVDLSMESLDLNSITTLAGLSRALAGNDWQRRSGEFALEKMAGEPSDRNRFLWL